MGRGRIWEAAIGLCLSSMVWGLPLTPMAAQEGAEEVTKLDLGFDIGMPGNRVSIPIVLNAPDGIRVGMTLNEITFPAKWLEFEEVQSGSSADLADAQASAAVKRDDQNAENTILEVKVAGKEGTMIPNGVVASVVLRISEEAPVDQEIKLTNRARALSADNPVRPIEPIAGRDGGLEVIAAPPAIYACFFYRH